MVQLLLYAIVGLVVVFVLGLVASWGKGKVLILSIVCMLLGAFFPPLEIVAVLGVVMLVILHFFT